MFAETMICRWARLLAAYQACCLAWMWLGTCAGLVLAVDNRPGPVEAAKVGPAQLERFVQQFCLDCHSGSLPSANLGLDQFAVDQFTSQQFARHAHTWETVVRRLRARQMPPVDAERPAEEEYRGVLAFLERQLDELAAAQPQPGRTNTFRRLTRIEYQNAIRDLLGVEIDAAAMLPADEVSLGFDNITVGDLSPTLLKRYLSAAEYISRIAVARPTGQSDGKTFRIPPDVTQEKHVDGLPLGTRGGGLVRYHFPADGVYEIRVRLTRDRNEHVEGLHEPHRMEVLLDAAKVGEFTVRPPRGKAGQTGPYNMTTHQNVDQHLVTSFTATAGPHDLGVTFVKNPSSLLETERQPLNVHFNMYRHPRLGPAVYEFTVTGPISRGGSEHHQSASPSRQLVFTCYPEQADQEDACAEQIITQLLRRACHMRISAEDLAGPLEIYREARQQGTFDSAIEAALAAVLVHPRFLFRVETDPTDSPPATSYQVNDYELAARLSFFLWSSLPDGELLELADLGQLRDPAILERQTLRMLADKRASALVDNFAGQWLYLRNLESITPDLRLFPDFDDNLRQAMRKETELFFESIVREDRSVLDLIKSDYTYLNERLAKHYQIPHVHGSHFRRVSLSDATRRGGLLRQGSILTVTSYATRTSPVIRGKWILENVLGTPPPPPPADVPALSDNVVSAQLSVRERLAQHRADAACASCHQLIDPAGFALENFDAVGRWRDIEEGRPVDAVGGLPDGTNCEGVDGLEQGLLRRPELFVGLLAEKLLTYALGRKLEHYDAAAIRQIVRSSEKNGYRFSSLVLGIIHSLPFQMRSTP